MGNTVNCKEVVSERETQLIGEKSRTSTTENRPWNLTHSKYFSGFGKSSANQKKVQEETPKKKASQKACWGDIWWKRTDLQSVQVSNFIEEPEEIVYYEESFPGEFDDAVVVDYEETPFDEQVC